MHPVIALVTAGVEMDVLGIAYSEFSDAEREAVVHAHPRSDRFKEDIIQAIYDGIRHKPHTTFGNVKADVLNAPLRPQPPDRNSVGPAAIATRSPRPNRLRLAIVIFQMAFG
jgi:hypothetical protein